MLMDVDAQRGLDVREDRGVPLRISGHDRDLCQSVVTVYLTRLSDGSVHEVGQAAGAAVGTDFIIDCTMAVDPGYYEMEVGVEGEPIVYPTDAARPRVEVIDTRYNN